MAAGGVPQLVLLLQHPNPVVSGQGLQALARLADHALAQEAIRCAGACVSMYSVCISVCVARVGGHGWWTTRWLRRPSGAPGHAHWQCAKRHSMCSVRGCGPYGCHGSGCAVQGNREIGLETARTLGQPCSPSPSSTNCSASPAVPCREAGGLTRLVQLTADAVAATAPPTAIAVGLAAAAGPSGSAGAPAAAVRPASPGAFDRRGTLLPAVQLLQVRVLRKTITPSRESPASRCCSGLYSCASAQLRYNAYCWYVTSLSPVMHHG